MRGLLWASLLSIAILAPDFCNAGETVVSKSGRADGTDANEKSYRGYYFDLSEIAGRKDSAVTADALRHQLDIVESVGLSPHLLQFFHSIPIVADEAACMDAPLRL